MIEMKGQCLCGEVTFVAMGPSRQHHACHCGMCRRWTGGPMMAIPVEGVRFEGEAHLQRFDSSNWAQRGFCSRCGTSLFYYFKTADRYFMSRGAFDEQDVFTLVGEIYVDAQPKGYGFQGDLERLTEAEFLVQFQSPES